MRGSFAPRAGALPTGGIFVYGFSDMAWPRLAGQREKESKDGGEDEGRWQPEADPRTAFNSAHSKMVAGLGWVTCLHEHDARTALDASPPHSLSSPHPSSSSANSHPTDKMYKENPYRSTTVLFRRNCTEDLFYQ